MANEQNLYPIYDIINLTRNGARAFTSPRMYRVDPGIDVVRNEILNDPKYRGEVLEFEIAPVRHDTWVLLWFNHWTFDIGQSDEDALKSFREYVERQKLLCLTDGDYEFNRLMGAADEYRWRGANHGAAPCRCGDCKNLGRITIDH